MQKKITYWTRNYTPEKEGVSKEIYILKNHFNCSRQFNLSSKMEIILGKKYSSINKFFAPLWYLVLKSIERETNISHIFCSLDEFPYIRCLNKRPIILTSAEGISHIEKNKKYFHKIKILVVESNREKKRLEKRLKGIKIKVIYPGIDLKQFNYKQNKNPTVLFLSTPFCENQVYARGLDIILSLAKLNPDINFLIPIRERIKWIKNLEKQKNILIIEKLIDPKKIFDNIDVTIAPFRGYKKNKPCPNSIIESLAAGKPVLVSKDVGISDIISQEKCGVVSKLDIISMDLNLKKIFSDYESYQKKCLPTAKKYFSKEKFLKEYESIYLGL